MDEGYTHSKTYTRTLVEEGLDGLGVCDDGGIEVEEEGREISRGRRAF